MKDNRGNLSRTSHAIMEMRGRRWTGTENRIKGDVSTKAGCLAIADALTKAGVTKVYPYPLHSTVSMEGTDWNRWIPSSTALA